MHVFFINLIKVDKVWPSRILYRLLFWDWRSIDFWYQGCPLCQVLEEYLLYLGFSGWFGAASRVADQHCWKLSNSRIYPNKSAYNAFFMGAIHFAPWRKIWRSWATLQCKKLFMWLIVKNGVGLLADFPREDFSPGLNSGIKF